MARQLTSKQKRFVENYILRSMSIAESVRRANYAIKSGRSEDYASLGCRMLKTERVANAVSKLREKQFAKDVLSISEKRSFLARAVRTPVGEINEGSDLAQEVTISEGANGTSRKIRAVDKLRCIELDSRISGDFYADRNENVSNPFLFLVTLGREQSQAIQQVQPVSLPASHPASLPDAVTIDAELVE
jgi:hypothetical protein